jgi:hypothetical protein
MEITIEEHVTYLRYSAKERYIHGGGQSYSYIPADLNSTKKSLFGFPTLKKKMWSNGSFSPWPSHE